MDYPEKEYKELSVIILNYKNTLLTAKCVNYLIESVNKADISIEVIVVDNSALETADELKRILPSEVKFIENNINQGFSRANNKGIRLCTGEFILLLNNDAFVNSECLRAGLNYLKENKDCGIWSPKLIDGDGSFQVSCARLPSIKGLIGEYLLFRNFDWYDDVKEWRKPRNVGNVIGAFLLFEKSLID